MSKKIEAGFRTWRDPYRVRWLNKKVPIDKYTPRLGAVSFWDERAEEDVELIPVSQELEWIVLPVRGSDGEYDVSADGVIILDIEPKVLSGLKKAGCIVDHFVEFVRDGAVADADSDYEFIENSKIELDLS